MPVFGISLLNGRVTSFSGCSCLHIHEQGGRVMEMTILVIGDAHQHSLEVIQMYLLTI